jgi:hypothetical protein
MNCAEIAKRQEPAFGSDVCLSFDRAPPIRFERREIIDVGNSSHLRYAEASRWALLKQRQLRLGPFHMRASPPDGYTAL